MYSPLRTPWFSGMEDELQHRLNVARDVSECAAYNEELKALWDNRTEVEQKVDGFVSIVKDARGALDKLEDTSRETTDAVCSAEKSLQYEKDMISAVHSITNAMGTIDFSSISRTGFQKTEDSDTK